MLVMSLSPNSHLAVIQGSALLAVPGEIFFFFFYPPGRPDIVERPHMWRVIRWDLFRE